MLITKPVLAAVAAAAIGLAACGSSGNSSSATTSPAASPTSADQAMAEKHMEAFCAKAKDFGSLTKGTADAMAMSPAESAKDFQALTDKATALRADASTDLQADIDTLVSRLGLEVMLENHKANGSSPANEMAKLDAQKTSDDAAIARLVAAVKSECDVDIS